MLHLVIPVQIELKYIEFRNFSLKSATEKVQWNSPVSSCLFWAGEMTGQKRELDKKREEITSDQ